MRIKYGSYGITALGSSAAVGVAGYFAGGYSTASGNISGIDKITFPADTKTVLSATLTGVRSQGAGMANSAVAGYCGAGEDGGYITGIDKITFPADTKTTLSATVTNGA